MLAAALALVAATAAPDLLTTAERSAFERTGRYDEAVRLCRAYAARFPRRARCFTFGTTPEGREMVALAASADGTLEPRLARARRRPVVLFQGAIHAGELDGKDAGFILLRELLAAADGGPLARVTAVFVPALNVDGHERFGRNQRPNQRGPAEAGWRTTGQNYNLNRDYVKADAPEMRALLALLGKWDPIVYADLHVTDGAQFQHDLSVTLEPKLGYDPALRAEGAALSAALLASLERCGHLPIDFYPSFVDESDPASGFEQHVPPPRFGHGYWAARNRFGVLVEAHSWRPYGERVTAAVDFLRALLALAAERGPRWLALAARADADAPALAGREVALDFAPAGEPRTIAFRGYAYEREPSLVTGKPVVHYDESAPEVWNVPLRSEVRATATATLPRGGWVVPAAWAHEVGPLLRAHGVRFERLARPIDGEVETFRSSEATFRAESFEGRQRLEVKGAWARERASLVAGALFVPSAQARALLAAHLLEPAGPDSLLAWGTFNTAFEKKEYIEPYVLEPFARELLRKDPAVRAAFERRLASDPAFEKDAKARIEFFHQRHPSWDTAYQRYPVVRIEAAP